MIPKEGRYSIKHTINLGNYESIVVEHSVLFDMVESTDIVGAWAEARHQVDLSLSEDLKRAAQVTSFDSSQTYIHDWIEEVY